ncbi:MULTISPECIES: TetR/AcrR family transcriptional regulator [Nocardia]|uniref:TetR/AcrR family transcriptional regulator n=1 Tax=Nocardia TaxID=1817 RepID=UPI000D69A8FC|nr:MULTISPECIES: TetR/AcrR family transcriptional regulator [Nocardia]
MDRNVRFVRGGPLSSPTTRSAPRRVTRRRSETRHRLLTAAYDVFAEEGFGRASVERICDRAGFTRGAFYSNFASLDELFLAIWEQRSAAMLDDLRAALDGIAADGVGDLRDAIRRLEQAVPLDEAWFRISAEFTAHALRTPALRTAMADREEAIVAALVPTVVAALAGLGRDVADPVALGRAIVAVHDGTAIQVLMEPLDSRIRRARTDLLGHVVLAYSAPATTTPPTTTEG